MNKSQSKSDLITEMEKPWFKQAQNALPDVYRQFGIEIRLAHDHLVVQKDSSAVWRHLERAHILSQSSAWRHLCIHFVMFTYAMMRFEFREILGQIPRLLFAMPSSLLRIAPRGNTGRSNVGMLKSMPVPRDLERIFDSSRSRVGKR